MPLSKCRMKRCCWQAGWYTNLFDWYFNLSEGFIQWECLLKEKSLERRERKGLWAGEGMCASHSLFFLNPGPLEAVWYFGFRDCFWNQTNLDSNLDLGTDQLYGIGQVTLASLPLWTCPVLSLADTVNSPKSLPILPRPPAASEISLTAPSSLNPHSLTPATQPWTSDCQVWDLNTWALLPN